MTKQFDNQHNKMSKTHKRYWNVPQAELDSFKFYMTILSNNEENIDNLSCHGKSFNTCYQTW